MSDEKNLNDLLGNDAVGMSNAIINGMEETGAEIEVIRFMTQMSIAISLNRIANALSQSDEYGQTGPSALAQAISDGLRYGQP